MDEPARTELILAHLRDAQGLAVRAAGPRLERDEARGLGAWGCCQAAAEFDPARGLPFGALLARFVRRRVADRVRHERRVYRGRPPLDRRPAGLDPERREQLAAHLADLDAPAQAVLVALYGIDGLPPRTYKAAEAELGLSRERARRLEAAALARLRRLYDEDGDDGL